MKFNWSRKPPPGAQASTSQTDGSNGNMIQDFQAAAVQTIDHDTAFPMPKEVTAPLSASDEQRGVKEPAPSAGWDNVSLAGPGPHQHAVESDKHSKPTIGLPHMSPAELALLRQVLSSHCSRYLEFGSGGSTLLAARSNVETIVAVESDQAWAKLVAGHAEIAPLVASGRAAILHANIGQTKAWGAPLSESSKEQWLSYIQRPWAEWTRREQMPDFVFVDGRFRVASALSVIVAWHLSPHESAFPLVAIHDVIPERPSYQKLWEFFETQEEVETLRLLKPRSSSNGLSAFNALLANFFDPA